jgi:putative inorganic carbon (HCO3(-)) transporter
VSEHEPGRDVAEEVREEIPAPEVPQKAGRPARLRGAALAGTAGLRASAASLAARLGWRRLLAIALLLILIASPWPPLSALALLAYAVVAFGDPGLTTALLPLAAPFAYQPKDFFGPELPVVELLLLLALATSGVQLLLRWRREGRRGLGTAALLDLWDEARRLVGAPFGLQAAALVLLGTFSLLTVADPLHLHESLREYRTVVVEPAIYFFLARAGLRDRELRAIAITAFVGGATIVSVLAIGQVLTGHGVVAVEGVRRALGTYQHPNALALYLLRAAAFTLAFLALAPSPRRAYWLLGAAPLLVAALVLTFSRGALLGLGVGLALLGVALILRSNESYRGHDEGPLKRSLLIGIVILFGAGVLVLAILSLVNIAAIRGGNGSLGLRQMIWGSTLAMLRDHPAFGVGLDQFLTQYAPRYVNPAAWGERYTSHPHNLFLDFWARLGIMGLAWIAWTLSSLGLAVARAWRTTTDESRRLLIAAAIACAAGLTHGLVDNFYFLIDLAFVWWFLLSLVNIAAEEGLAAREIAAATPEPARADRRGRKRKRARSTAPALSLPEK